MISKKEHKWVLLGWLNDFLRIGLQCYFGFLVVFGFCCLGLALNYGFDISAALVGQLPEVEVKEYFSVLIRNIYYLVVFINFSVGLFRCIKQGDRLTRMFRIMISTTLWFVGGQVLLVENIIVFGSIYLVIFLVMILLDKLLCWHDEEIKHLIW